MVNIGNDWDALLEKEFEQPYYKQLRTFLAQEYRTHRIYPDMYSIFNALKFTPYGSVRVVILGQDPYPGPNKRTALPFRCSRASQRLGACKIFIKSFRRTVAAISRTTAT